MVQRKSDLTVLAEKYGVSKSTVRNIIGENPQLNIVMEPGKAVRLTQYQASALCSIIEGRQPSATKQATAQSQTNAEPTTLDSCAYELAMANDELARQRARVRELELANARLEQRVEALEAMRSRERELYEEAKEDLDRERAERTMAIVKAESMEGELEEARRRVDRINSAGLFARMFRKF